MFKKMQEFWRHGVLGSRKWTYVFLVRKAPTDRAVDDLVENDLARINTFIVADTIEDNQHLLILTTDDDNVTADQICHVLNDRFDLDAELLSKENTSEKTD
jgi:hypothetical protein